MTEREQAVIVAIAAEPPEPHRARQDIETPVLILVREEIRAGGDEQRLAKRSASARAHRPGLSLMAEQGFALAAPEALAGEGLVHHAEQRAALPREADQGAPYRQAEHKGTGAVDRVDHPAIFGVAADGPELLPDNTVGRMGPLR